MGKFWVRFLPLHAGSCFMEGSLHGVVIRVRIDVQRNAGVGMPHEILQTFHVNPGLLHIGAEGMTKNMRRDMGRLFPVELHILCFHAAKVVLQMHGSFRSAILVQKQKPAVPVHNPFNLRLLSIFEDVSEGLICGLTHGNASNPAGCFWAFDEVRAFRSSA